MRWLTYSVIFALTPLACSVLLRFFASKLTFLAVANSPEILFYSLMINATSLGDLSDVSRPKKIHDNTIEVFRSALTVAGIFSAILYGSLLLAEVFNETDPTFVTRIFWFSVVIAVASTLLAYAVQVFVSKVGGQPK